MARPRKTDVGTRRKALLEAARAALSEKGYRDVRLEDVATRARVAKGTLYLYFKNKEEMCSIDMREIVKRLEDRVRSIHPQKTALEKFARIAVAEIDFIDENRDFLSHFSPQRSPMLGPSGTKSLKECFKDHVEQLAVLLRRLRPGRLLPQARRAARGPLLHRAGPHVRPARAAGPPRQAAGRPCP